MAHEIPSKIWRLVRGAAALVTVFGFLAAVAVTVTVGSILQDDEDSRKSRSSLPSSLR